VVCVQLCLKCPDCNKLLDSTTLTENNGEVRRLLWLRRREAAGRMRGSSARAPRCVHYMEWQVYCKACYAKRFGPKGFGFAGGAAMMHSS